MKRDDKLFSIGEIAKALGVTRRIILHYEERGLIEPDKRDDATNNRYYTIDTFTKLRSIRSLQNLGLTLDEIRDYYNDSTDLMPLIRRMEEMRDQLNLNINCRAGQGILRSGQELELPQQLIYCRTTAAITWRTGPFCSATQLWRPCGPTVRISPGGCTSSTPIDRREVSCCVAVPRAVRENMWRPQRLCRPSASITTVRMRSSPPWAASFWTTPRSTA
ncbi:MAG: MerR family transcriptional regulator [Oscillospiraceae bacterium]